MGQNDRLVKIAQGQEMGMSSVNKTIVCVVGGIVSGTRQR